MRRASARPGAACHDGTCGCPRGPGDRNTVSRNWSCWPTSAGREADKVQSILVRTKRSTGVRFPQSRFASRTSGTPRMMPQRLFGMS